MLIHGESICVRTCVCLWVCMCMCVCVCMCVCGGLGGGGGGMGLFILLQREILAHLEFSLIFRFSLVHRSCILCSLFCIFLMSYYTSLRFLTQLHIHTVLCIKCVLWELQKSLNDEYGELQSLHLVCFLIYQWNCSPMNLCFTTVIFEI